MTDTSLRAGDTYSVLVSLTSYPASDGWVLKSRFTPRAGGVAIELTAAAEGSAHRLSASAATTAAWPSGDYAAVQWVELGAQAYTVDSGDLTILPDLRTILGATDTRSQAQIALAAAKAALASWSPTQKRYRIGAREMEFNSPADIIAVINHWTAEVKREQSAAAMAEGRPSPRKLLVRMGRA